MGILVPINWCLIFFRDPDHEFTPDQLRQVLVAARLSVTGDEQPFAVQYHNGPILSVSVQHATYLETIISGLSGLRRKHRPLIPGCNTQITIELPDVEAVLDESNTLVEAQSTLQAATGGLMYMSWNLKFAGPDE